MMSPMDRSCTAPASSASVVPLRRHLRRCKAESRNFPWLMAFACGCRAGWCHQALLHQRRTLAARLGRAVGLGMTPSTGRPRAATASSKARTRRSSISRASTAPRPSSTPITTDSSVQQHSSATACFERRHGLRRARSCCSAWSGSPGCVWFRRCEHGVVRRAARFRRRGDSTAPSSRTAFMRSTLARCASSAARTSATRWRLMLAVTPTPPVTRLSRRRCGCAMRSMLALASTTCGWLSPRRALSSCSRASAARQVGFQARHQPVVQHLLHAVGRCPSGLRLPAAGLGRPAPASPRAGTTARSGARSRCRDARRWR